MATKIGIFKIANCESRIIVLLLRGDFEIFIFLMEEDFWVIDIGLAKKHTEQSKKNKSMY